MLSAKDRIIEITKRQPEDSTYKEIINELVINSMIARSLEQAERGEGTTLEDFKKEIEQW